jgi:hypothetical protein
MTMEAERIDQPTTDPVSDVLAGTAQFAPEPTFGSW